MRFSISIYLCFHWNMCFHKVEKVKKVSSREQTFPFGFPFQRLPCLFYLTCSNHYYFIGSETSETVFMARRIQFKMCQKMYRWCKDYLFEVLFRVKVCWWTLMNESLSSVPEVG